MLNEPYKGVQRSTNTRVQLLYLIFFSILRINTAAVKHLFYKYFGVSNILLCLTPTCRTISEAELVYYTRHFKPIPYGKMEQDPVHKIPQTALLSSILSITSACNYVQRRLGRMVRPNMYFLAWNNLPEEVYRIVRTNIYFLACLQDAV